MGPRLRGDDRKKLIPGSPNRIYIHRALFAVGVISSDAQCGTKCGARQWRREWSAGRRSALRHWARAPRKRSPRVTGNGRRRAAGRAKPAIGRCASALAPPRRSVPLWETEKGKPACPAPSKNMERGAYGFCRVKPGNDRQN